MIYRKTRQALPPLQHFDTAPGQYDIYPGFDIGSGRIFTGFDALADRIERDRIVTIDGYGGVLWEEFRAELEASLRRRGISARFLPIDAALKPAPEIEEIVAPYIGGDDPLFGTRFTGKLRDFFDSDRLRALRPAYDGVEILYGTGAALANWDGTLVYVDIPKNEIQFRSRAGSVGNLGMANAASPKSMYKRYYFVDWIALNRHKKELLSRIDFFVDAQRADIPTLIAGEDLRAAISKMSHSPVRVRPWFEPGPWGGHWIKQRIPQLPQDEPNYAWSFELIAPENGLLLRSDGVLLEFSFDMLLFQEHRNVLGRAADIFGYEFPIRFDFLDTVRGGNLSLQCHPRSEYIRKHFGENFTQHESYYILDCIPGAQVYLGFREDIDPQRFRAELERSERDGSPVDVEEFAQTHPAHRHDLFLIPGGTIHCSGVGNLVLEISSTPYIFTFKMYDWLRADLDGKPRPLNVARAFENLNFERRGATVQETLIAHPEILAEGTGWRIVHLPTHPEQFYDVHRFEFESAFETETGDSCHVLSLVEGSSVLYESATGQQRRLNYAETWIVPAAAGRYWLINEGTEPAKVIKAFVKSDVVL